MEMSSANEIRYILNEIDEYTKKLKNIEDCTKLTVTIHIGGNGLPTTYTRNDIEVEGIINAYKKYIENLEARIRQMK